ncbi:MAG: ABC transporter permease [Candidatus ainarchaeum sp.]|nr:ABC transporter permease [Candidatus ainarchaeum sp.]
MPIDTIFEAIKNLRREGIKTFLTLLGVVIGIMAIVSLASIGAGLSESVTAQFEELGSNTIFIIPSGMGVAKISLTQNDIRNVENIIGVKSVVPIYSTQAKMEFNGKKINVSVNAVEEDKSDLFGGTGYFEVGEGRNFSKNESSSILVGNKIGKDYFDKEINIRKQILINDVAFKVIGILEAQPASFGGAPNSSSVVYMSYEGFKKITDKTDATIIFASSQFKDETSDVAEKIKDYFDKKYGEESVTVSASEQLLDQINVMLGMITLFIMGIGAISLVVGGVGIMNAMLTSVLQRTKEIGTYKALGATSQKILAIFLIEAGLIGLIGGIIGIIFGYATASLIAYIGTESGFALNAIMTSDIIITSLLFSMTIGIVAGILPAIRAANLDPVEALRFE